MTSTPAARPSPHLDSLAVARWRQDLAFLRAAMPAGHANLFHAMRPAQFDSALTSIEDRLLTLTREQVVVELMRLAALVGDGHTNVSPWRDSAVAFHELPVALYWFADGVAVRAATREHSDLVGARVLAIGGTGIDSAVAVVRPLIARDNAMGVRAYAPILLTMPEVLEAVGLVRDANRVALTVLQRGRRRTVVLRALGPYPFATGETDRTWDARPGWVDAREGVRAPLWLSQTSALYRYRYLAEARTLYCQINAILQNPDDSLDRFMARAIAAGDSAGAERLVLDLRLNGGGNGEWKHVIVRALIKSRYDVPGRLFVITGRRTWSAAGMLTDAIEDYTNARFVGEPGASRGNSYRDSHRIVLPNARVTVRVSTLYWQLWDPRDQRPWIAPSVAASLTLADYAAGRDPALEAAVSYPR